jgi:hypothetical protein
LRKIFQTESLESKTESEFRFQSGYQKSEPKIGNPNEEEKKRPGTNSMVRVPKKVHFEKHCDLCNNYGGACAMHNTCNCCRFEKDGKEKSNFYAAKKGGKKSNPGSQNFMQLTKKIEKLEKGLKKSGKKGQKRH